MAVDDVAAMFDVDESADGVWLTSTANGRRMRVGRFETPSLVELRERAACVDAPGSLRAREVVADARELHTDPSVAGATFQVASQFNTLEMIGPDYTPGDGITIYGKDHTQGPACAIACGAGTLWRNYLADLGDGVRGQVHGRQIDCLAGLASALGHEIEMQNGYAFPTESQLASIADQLASATEAERDELRSALRVGVMWQTEVTWRDAGHLVSQVYGSALPVIYGGAGEWEPFARLVLEASYEATLHAAVLNAEATGNRTLFLTLLGGSAFGNDEAWILDAIERSLDRFADTDLDVAIVSYRDPNPSLTMLTAS